MKDTNIIRNFIRNELKKINLMEADNYPVGAANDPSAPWNQSSSPEISKIRIMQPNSLMLLQIMEMNLKLVLLIFWKTTGNLTRAVLNNMKPCLVRMIPQPT